MKNLSLRKVSYFTAFIYTALIGAGMYTSLHINGIPYNTPRLVETLVWFEIIMTIFALIMAVKFFSWKELGFTKIKNVLWFLPMGIVGFIVLFNLGRVTVTHDFTSEQWKLFGKVAFTTFLVGFSEELVYRGVVFTTFIKESKVKALVISAITFSLLHWVNIFGGLAVGSMLAQLVLTLIAGFFFGFVRMKIDSIIPIIFFHWIWDFNLLGGQVLQMEEMSGNFTTAFVIMEIVFVLTYLPYFIYQEIKKNK